MLNSKVFILEIAQMKQVRFFPTRKQGVQRDRTGAVVTDVVLPRQFCAGPPLPFARFLEGALRKIKASSAARIEPKTNPTGRECDPPGGQSLCWRDIGSNAGFIQL